MNHMKKLLVVGVILLFLGSSIPILLSKPIDQHVHLGGTQGKNGWYVSGVSVTLDTDGDLKLNDGAWQTYTGPFWIGSEGRNILYARGWYNGSNWSEEYHLNIDMTPPVCVPDANLLTWNNTILFSACCVDNTSGIDHVELFADGALVGNYTVSPYQFVWHGKGWLHTVGVKAYDIAGNNNFVEKQVFLGFLTHLLLLLKAILMPEGNSNHFV
jgi:hypothetical protein